MFQNVKKLPSNDHESVSVTNMVTDQVIPKSANYLKYLPAGSSRYVGGAKRSSQLPH